MTRLDIFADPICPWSYIGKAHLDQALREHEGPSPFRLRWLPFFLNPTMPKRGMARSTYLRETFGSDQAVYEAYLPITEYAERAKLDLNLAAITHTPNTIDAHRLIHWAGLEDKATLVIGLLMAGYFRDGLDLGDHDHLCDIAEMAAMDPQIIRRLLMSDADRRDIVEQDASARAMGVNASPTFIVAGQHVVPGAQSPDLWRSVIKDLDEISNTIDKL